MRAVSKYIYMLLLSVPLFFLSGCYDDTFDDYRNPDGYPEGNVSVRMSMDFEPFASNSLGTRSKPGDSLDELEGLCVLAYDIDGNLMEGFPVEITKDDHKLHAELVDREDGDAANDPSAEDKTWHATFTMQVPYGRYYLYGVANLGRHNADGSLATTTFQELSEGGRYHSHLQKREDFLNIQTEWDEDNILNNGEMLGYFTDGKESKSPSTGLQTNNKTIDVNRPGMELHTWLRRSASKVTIDFDGSALDSKVTIYVRRATIHDIPKTCVLGLPNTPVSESQIYSYKNNDYRPDDTSKGDHIDYSTESDYKKWPAITRVNPQIMDENGKPKSFHGYTSEAMFLYENMQYEGETDKDINKEQQAGADGFVIGADEMKDNMPYGSYIEVEAFYERKLYNNETTKGKLIYRFMLGKDIIKNFEVERNYHFKLTMRPRGYGNDVDWHIEYMAESGFDYKDPYYVSYLYNHDSTMRFRYDAPEGFVVDSIQSVIVGNNWWPDEAGNDIYAANEANTQNPNRSENQYTDADNIDRIKYLGNGFLSLRATDETIIKVDMTSDFKSIGAAQYGTERMAWMNDNYFYAFEPTATDNGKDWVKKHKTGLIDRSRRTYYFNESKSDPTNKGREAYEVKKMPDGAYMFNLPMYTRAKNLVKASGFTGNNPYEGHTRTAYVRATVFMHKGSQTKTDSQLLRVIQVPRITNPKGIYRRSGNNENFEVILTERDGDNGVDFEKLTSDGPWMAEVIGDANFINLNGRATIKGTGGEVKFNVRFNKMNRDDNVRNAVIRIRYHNYSCVHLIFVRQGYSSQAIVRNGKQWHTNNLVYDGVDANGLDPRDEGSLFKFGNLTQPIDAHCNVYTNVGGIGMYQDYDKLGPTSTGRYDIANANLSYSAGSLTWSEIDDIDDFGNGGFAESSGVAEMKDYEDLYRNSNVEQGFGVLYADGATTTQMTVPLVYGYSRYDPDNERDKKGMLGVFVYYWDRENVLDEYTAKNIFFPIGRAGYGHRKHGETLGAGTLKYACSNRRKTFDWPATGPLFYDLARRKGAIYYARYIDQNRLNVDGQEEGDAIGLDINFFSFDFNLISKSNVGHGRDACFVRRVGQQTRGKDEVKKAMRRPRR